MHIRIEQTNPVAGFVVENARAGEEAKILYRAHLTSDDSDFYGYVEKFCGMFLPANVLINSLHQFLIVIHKDLSADLYINDFPVALEMKSKTDIEKGQLVGLGDIADIRRLRFSDIGIDENDQVIYCFKVGWRFGLFFDLSAGRTKPVGEDLATQNTLQLEELETSLGRLYGYLSFYHVYKTLEAESQFKDMVNDGWFPFVEILATDFKYLSEAYANTFDLENKIVALTARFTNERIGQITGKWWQKQHFEGHRAQIQAGIDAFLQNTRAGNINCIKNLWSEMEGVLRAIYVADTGSNRMTQNDLITHIVDKATKESGAGYSLLMELPFLEYLRDVAFAKFDVESGDVPLSRNSSGHGVAGEEQYTRPRALQLILILDQIYFFS